MYQIARRTYGIGCKMFTAMIIQRLTRICLFVLLLSLPGFAGQKISSTDQKTASIGLTVVKDANGKPVKNAEVVLHLINNHGKQMQEGLELKTHDDGKAEATGIPYGKVRIQVIAPGFQKLTIPARSVAIIASDSIVNIASASPSGTFMT